MSSLFGSSVLLAPAGLSGQSYICFGAEVISSLHGTLTAMHSVPSSLFWYSQAFDHLLDLTWETLRALTVAKIAIRE